MKKAILIMPENGNDADLTTNGVHLVTIIEHLDNLSKGLSQQLVKEATEIVGGDPREQEKYLQKLCDEAHRQQGNINNGMDFRDIIKGQN